MAQTAQRERPVFRNIHISQIVGYRLPLAGVVSILHRISGALLFVFLPFLIWLFDLSITSEISYERFASVFVVGAFGLPAWLVKLLLLALIWAYLHHFIAGVRHLWMDVSHDAVDLKRGRASALFTLVAAGLLTLALGAKLFGLY